MHAFVFVCGLLSTACALVTGLPYMRSIVRGKTQPHQYTWLVWAIMNAIVVVSQVLSGGLASVLVYMVYFVYSVINFVLALKYGVRDSSRFDRLLLGLSLATIVVWALTKSNLWAIWLSVLIDVCATGMLVLKIRTLPGTEPLRLWIISTMAFVFSCLTLAGKPFGILYIRPLYGVVSTAAIVVAILIYKPTGNKQAKAGNDAISK
jgi:hypothetical protein